MSKHSILRVDASMRHEGSYSRKLADQLVATLQSKQASNLVVRDLSEGVGLINEAWIGANFTDKADRTDDQKAVLAQSDALVSEIKAADTLVISVPIYNFGVPAALKAWIDLVCRARETFRYTENGPEGLLEGKKAYIIVTSGGTEAFSDIDFASNYMRHVLGFIGINDVNFVEADRLMMDEQAALERANAKIEAVA
jgi:FMN-dependent NADH-azoreductase